MHNEQPRRYKEIKEMFRAYMNERNNQYLSKNIVQGMIGLAEYIDKKEVARWQRIGDDFRDKRAEVIHSDSKVSIIEVKEEHPYIKLFYEVLITWRIRHFQHIYEQAWLERRECIVKGEYGWRIVSDYLVEQEGDGSPLFDHPDSLDVNYEVRNPNERRAKYNRAKAVQYANTWWNDYNPKFKRFEVDCTNFISQCMWAGSAPMKHSSNRAKGWWYRFEQPVNWSYSWAVAHALRWYLPSSRSGLRCKEVSSADQLQPGDVICYDFDGDGHWQHNTIVVAKDGAGMPLVNAHTTNSRYRYWDYRDSYAWTDKTAYKFFQIIDEF